MNPEIIEEQLLTLGGCCLIRPGLGRQSDSWFGEMCLTKSSDHRYQFCTNSGFAMLFSIDDVSSVELDKKVIRLKGPLDYV